MQVYKNILYFRCRLHYNIGKIIHKNVNNIFYIQNFSNFKTDFFLKPILASISCEANVSMGWLYVYDNYIQLVASTVLQMHILIS